MILNCKQVTRCHVVLVLLTATLAACIALPNGPGDFAPPDPALVEAGQRLFYECAACHTVGPNEFHSLGPNLYGVFGSKAGTRKQFAYSEALRTSDIVWTRETMDDWLRKPSEFIPGNIMAYIGMPDEHKRKAIIAYLQTETAKQ